MTDSEDEAKRLKAEEDERRREQRKQELERRVLEEMEKEEKQQLELAQKDLESEKEDTGNGDQNEPKDTAKPPQDKNYLKRDAALIKQNQTVNNFLRSGKQRSNSTIPKDRDAMNEYADMFGLPKSGQHPKGKNWLRDLKTGSAAASAINSKTVEDSEDRERRELEMRRWKQYTQDLADAKTKYQANGGNYPISMSKPPHPNHRASVGHKSNAKDVQTYDLSSGDEKKTFLLPRTNKRQREYSGEDSESEYYSSNGDLRGGLGRGDMLGHIIKDVANKLPKFDGDHYSRWAREAKRVLRLTHGEELIRRDYGDTDDPVMYERDQLVAAYLESHISEEIKNEMTVTTGSAYDIWHAVKRWYDDKDGADLDKTFSLLRSLKLNGDIDQYKDQFIGILKVLDKFDVSMPKEFLVFSFLEGLGDRGTWYRREYSKKDGLDPRTVCLDVCRSFERPEKKKYSIDHIKKPFKQKAGSKKPNGFTVSKLPFFQARQRSNAKKATEAEDEVREIYFGKKSDKLPEGVCWKCGKEGHLFKDCPKMKGAIRVLINIVSQAHGSIKWIFDTGAAVPVTNNKSWFNPGTYVKHATVFGSIDNGGILEAEGYGEVTLILKSGIAITIPHVFYCPKASVNVITNIDLDPKVRFLIDSVRGHVWLDEQNETECYDFCRVLDNMNVIQLKSSCIHAVTRAQKAARVAEEEEESAKKRLKSVVKRPDTEGKQSKDGQESSKPKPEQSKQDDQEINLFASDDDLDEPTAESSDKSSIDGAECDLRELLNQKKAEKEPDPIRTRTYPQKMHELYADYKKQAKKLQFADTKEMHLAYGHPGMTANEELCTIHGKNRKFTCEICRKHNLTLKHSNEPSQKWTEGPLELVHMDLFEPYPSITGYDGSKYVVMIVDDYTNKKFVYTINNKETETVLDVFKMYMKYAERWHNTKIKKLHTDFGKEFDSEAFWREVRELGIDREFGQPYIHYQNGKVENANQKVQNKMRKMMETSGLPTKYWPEIVKAACYLIDRTPRQNGIAPHVLWYRRYDLRQLYIVGSKVFYREPGKVKKAWSNPKKATFMGYDRNTDGYRLLDEETGRIVIKKFLTYCSTRGVNAIRLLNKSELPKRAINAIRPTEKTANPICILRQAKMKENVRIPRNETEAMRSKNSQKWLEGMQQEIERMYQEGVFENVPFENQNLIETRWTYDYKPKEKRFSARLVARGDHQQPHQFDETFAPTMGMHVLRLLLCIAINFGLIVWNVDVQRAFLNAKLLEEIFIRPPKILRFGSGTVIRLRKALYGLRQSGNAWHRELSSYLKSIGFVQMPREPCVFVHKTIPHLYIGTYVDDLIIVCESEQIKDHVVRLLSKKYKLHDRGSVTELLGVQFERFEDRWEYGVQELIEKLAEQFGCEKDPRVITPLSAGEVLTPLIGGLPADKELYHSGLGSVLYIARVGRADVMFPVVQLSQFRENPKKAHYRKMTRLITYLLNTATLKMTIRQSDLRLEVHTDASFASNFDYRGFRGVLVKFGNSVLRWTSKKLNETAQSTDEAEIIAAYEALRELSYFRRLICELLHGRLKGFRWEDESCPVCDHFTPIMHVDNQSTIAFCKKGFGKRTNHLSVKYIHLHECLESGFYRVEYIPSKSNLADVFTKNLPKEGIATFLDATSSMESKKEH